MRIIKKKIMAWKYKRELTRRWRNKNDGKPHNLPGPLIVSLTSYPARFVTLPLTIKCLLSQSIKPDRVVLWIAHEDRDNLTADILCLKKYGLEIIYCEDIKSYKKIIPLLSIGIDSFIVTADDDAYYWQTWLEDLVVNYSGNNKEILCHRAHKIRLDDLGQPLPYDQWVFDTDDNTCSSLIFPTGLGGVLYPPNVFCPDVLKTDLFMSLCPFGDDIWLYWMTRLNRGKARKVGVKHKFFLWPETQVSSLWNINRLPDGNDLKINSMIKRYGFPL